MNHHCDITKYERYHQIHMNVISHAVKFSKKYLAVKKIVKYRKDPPNKLYLPTQMGKDQLDDLKLDGLITSRILGGIAWDSNQAK